jgi:hypothetical protein
MAILAWTHRYQINTDGVSYIRIAQYYANGQWELMVSGYWGPLISWLMAPLLYGGLSGLAAARVVMAVSGMTFLVGAMALLIRLGVPRYALAPAAGMLALVTSVLTADVIAPDLLVAGLICLGMSYLIDGSWPQRRPIQVAAGFWFGAAYLAKPVALPVFATLLCLMSLGWRFCDRTPSRTILRAIAATSVACMCVAGPWILVISLKYQRPLIATTARIAHAVIGPPDVDRFHPTFREFIAPDPGRITTWEDPTGLPYRYWSPFDSPTYLLHQLRIIRGNVARIRASVERFGAGLGVFAIVIGFALHSPWRTNMRRQRWRWALVALLSSCLPYVPMYANAARYYYCAIPLLFTANICVIDDHLGAVWSRKRWHLKAVSWMLALVFSLPVVAAEGRNRNGAVPSWKRLASALATHENVVSLAGNDNAVLFIALELDVPALGVVRNATHEDLVRSGASVLIVRTDSEPVRSLDSDSAFERIPVASSASAGVQAGQLVAFRRR